MDWGPIKIFNAQFDCVKQFVNNGQVLELLCIFYFFLKKLKRDLALEYEWLWLKGLLCLLYQWP
jgi:hypothetical protein